MDTPTRQRYETQSKDLRVKIKSWEVDFYNAHHGNKPSRKDIKESEMAGTYKEYQRLRDILSGKLPPPKPPKATTDDSQLRKRKSPIQHHALSYTPSTKRFKTVETPSSRGQHHGESIALQMFTPGSGAGLTPSLSRKLFNSSPAVPTSIGPTPQRDGHVLGLFDSLPFKDADIDSPSKPNGAVRLSEVIKAGRQVMAAQQTPRKASRLSDGQPSSAASLGRTPSSRHKRHGGPSPRKSLLSTPLKLDGSNRVAKTPGTSDSVSRLQFQTPAFLRRIPMPRINEDSPELKMRLPRKPLMRGLSSVVADLRRMQEEELDDELDALREAEMEMEGGGPSRPVNRAILSDKTNLPTTSIDDEPPPPAEKPADASILEEDNEKQALNLLGGFDDEGDYDSAGEHDAGLDRNGIPLRVYKKKGQKRTTRKSNMKPVMKRRATTTVADAKAEDEDNENAPSSRRPRAATTIVDEDQESGEDDGSEFAGSDDEDEVAQDPTTSKRKNKTSKAAAAAAPKMKKAAVALAAKKAPRKVNEHAHANFKRLKLRNNGAKGGPGHNSRFKRRR